MSKEWLRLQSYLQAYNDIGIEVKRKVVDTPNELEADTNLATSYDTVELIPTIAQGTGDDDRIGDRIHPIGVELTWAITQMGTEAYVNFGVIIDNLANHALITSRSNGPYYWNRSGTHYGEAQQPGRFIYLKEWAISYNKATFTAMTYPTQDNHPLHPPCFSDACWVPFPDDLVITYTTAAGLYTDTGSSPLPILYMTTETSEVHIQYDYTFFWADL